MLKLSISLCSHFNTATTIERIAEMNTPLISLIILSYNNNEYIYGMLDSILKQDYGRIELIISDDGSDNFPAQTINKYINHQVFPKFEKTFINHNTTNLGTVKNTELALKHCSGKYVMILGADDELYSPNTISILVSEFENFADDVEVFVSQAVICDEHLRVTNKVFTDSRYANIINSDDSSLLFSELSLRCFIAAPSTVYKRSAFSKIGTLSDKYTIVEDWASYLRLARAGVKFRYKNILSVKHREGGVSCGNKVNSSGVHKKYRLDSVAICENEIIPYLHIVCKEYIPNILKNYSVYKMYYKYSKYENILSILGIRKIMLPPLRWLLHFIAKILVSHAINHKC